MDLRFEPGSLPAQDLCLSHEDRAEHFSLWKRTATKRVHPASKTSNPFDIDMR